MSKDPKKRRLMTVYVGCGLGGAPDWWRRGPIGSAGTGRRAGAGGRRGGAPGAAASPPRGCRRPPRTSTATTSGT